MIKIFLLLFFYFIWFSSLFAFDDIYIISREDWWADEEMRFLDSSYWQYILKKREENSKKTDNTIYTQAQIEAFKKKQEKNNQINDILLNEYKIYDNIWDVISYENWRKLAWPINKSKDIKAIVIHHTTWNYTDSYQALKDIYKYHTLTRQWWDIGYNYLIWLNWEIFEWRAGWDYVVWAHNLYNNISTLWIAIIWDYSEKPINQDQYNALRKLTRYLIEKYEIDLTEKYDFHEECFWNKCALPLYTEKKWPIIWHRDAWHTACPWDALYEQIEDLRKDLLKSPYSVSQLYKKKVFKTLSKFSDDKLITILSWIEQDLEKKYSSNKTKLKALLIEYFKYKKDHSKITHNKYYDENKIKIKLSYPKNDEITIKSEWLEFKIKKVLNKVSIKWKSFDVLKIPKKDKDSIIEISSWNRIPSWDKTWTYNDNKFKWDIYIYIKDWKLVVVNELKIEDYLKWLWEVSDFENPEKIKSIIVAARSYANYYIEKAEKFPWEFYNWSDNPNVFQKYLWYGLEQRSPNINKIVDETRWEVITYNWELIKPWYFSSSNWKTMSFYDYCIVRYSDKICSKESIKYPYLQSVVDFWSIWKDKVWHGVGISWAWVSYFAEKWWTYDMIIKYFLKWVDVL